MANSIDDCLQDAECVLVTTPDDVYKSLKPEDFIGNKEMVTVVDFWRCLPESIRCHAKIRYVPMGCCIEDASAKNRLERLWREDGT